MIENMFDTSGWGDHRFGNDHLLQIARELMEEIVDLRDHYPRVWAFSTMFAAGVAL